MKTNLDVLGSDNLKGKECSQLSKYYASVEQEMDINVSRKRSFKEMINSDKDIVVAPLSQAEKTFWQFSDTQVATRKHTIEDLPVEILCLIFSFKYTTKVSSSKALNSSQPFNIYTLFRSFGLASKNLRESCFRHVKQAPLTINISSLNTLTVAWLASHRVKVNSIQIAGDTTLQMGTSLFLLKCCDITDLNILRINSSTAYVKSSEAEISKAMHDGILPKPANIDIKSQANFHELIVDALVSGKARSVKKIEFAIEKHDFFSQFLTYFAETLEDLTLKINASRPFNLEDTERDMSAVTSAIASLTNLKKLQLRTWFMGCLRIYSQSLEEIDTYYAHDQFWVERCICPSLRLFKCRNFSYFYDCKNGLIPLKAFEEAELKPLRFDDGFLRWYERPSIEYRVGDRSFHGLKVPEDCIVQFRC